MATIVPRWERRTFGTRFGVAETRFAELTPGSMQESDELYFLGSSANAKVRDGLMDIKVLREVRCTSPGAKCRHSYGTRLSDFFTDCSGS
jgi:hypothetical protein